MIMSLVGCVDYSFDPPQPEYGAVNPPQLESDQRVDRILQVIQPKVDVLWIVDNSNSMSDDNELLARNFPKFVQPFVDSGSDWHIGVITTDMDSQYYQGRLVEKRGLRYLTPTSPDPVGTFTEMATGLSHSWTGLEKGRQAAWTALETLRDDYNYGFLHDDEDSWLHITVVTDEDDDSTRDPVGRDAFVDWLRTIRPMTNRTTFNSVVALIDDYPEERGDEYIALTERIGGGTYPLDSNWSSLLTDLGANQAPPPTDEFFLSAVPVPDTLDVHVVSEGMTFTFVQDVDYTWSRSRNSVKFLAWEPPLGATVEIAYTVASSTVGP